MDLDYNAHPWFSEQVGREQSVVCSAQAEKKVHLARSLGKMSGFYLNCFKNITVCVFLKLKYLAMQRQYCKHTLKFHGRLRVKADH